LTVSIAKKIGCPHTTIAPEEIGDPRGDPLKGLKIVPVFEALCRKIGTTEAGMSAD
jgi:hypothetical protein